MIFIQNGLHIWQKRQGFNMMKLQKYSVVKGILVLLLVIYLVGLCLSDSAKDLPMETITSSMSKANLSGLNECGKTELMRFYSLEEGNTEGYFFYKADSPMSVEELLIVKSASKSDAALILEQVQAHLDSQKNTFEGYGTDQMALLNEAIVETKGIYTYYMCGPHAASWRERFLSII